MRGEFSLARVLVGFLAEFLQQGRIGVFLRDGLHVLIRHEEGQHPLGQETDALLDLGFLHLGLEECIYC